MSRLGYDPFREEAPLDLRVRVVARGPSVRAEITSAQLGKPAGKRTLEDPRCDALGETLASAVALVLDPVAASAPRAEPEPAAEPAPTPLPAPAVVPVPAPPSPAASEKPEAAPPIAEPLSLVPLLYADATATFARAPGSLLGVRLGVGLRRGPLSAALEGHAETMPSSAAVAPSDRVDVSVYSGALVPCGHLGVFQLCAALTLGTRQAKALDVVAPRTQGAFFVAAGVRPGVELALSSGLAVRLHGEVGVPLIRTSYTIDGVPRSSASPIEGGVGAGILGRFR